MIDLALVAFLCYGLYKLVSNIPAQYAFLALGLIAVSVAFVSHNTRQQ